MSNFFKHILCLSLLVTILAVGACKKDAPVANKTTGLSHPDSVRIADSIKRVDSIYSADSIHKVDSLVTVHHQQDSIAYIYHQMDSVLRIVAANRNSLLGKFYCANHHSNSGISGGSDNIIGYDTIYVTATSTSAIVIRGEVFEYVFPYPYPNSHAPCSGYSIDAGSGVCRNVTFSNSNNTIRYSYFCARIGVGGSEDFYYAGNRVPWCVIWVLRHGYAPSI